MRYLFRITLLLIIFFTENISAQTSIGEIKTELISRNKDTKILTGLVLDKTKQTVLSFANIVILHKNKGTISNENGYFTLDISDIENSDSISFQYLGYKTFNTTISIFKENPIIFLEESVFNINEVFVFGNEPNAVKIIEKIIEKKDENYKQLNLKSQVFIRKKQSDDLNYLSIKFKKSSFKSINKKVTKLIEQKIPKHTTSYTDFLTFLYSSNDVNDSIKIKLEPIKMVSLKDKEINTDEIEKIFENLFKNTKESEYWKVKSGILSTKIQLDDEDSTNNEFSDLDSLKENEISLYYYTQSLEDKFKFTSMNDLKEWEFLYKPGLYRYDIVGGTIVNGEDVYIIDFEPRKGGKYIGKVFVSIETNALIRADYEFAPDVNGFSINLLGVSYTDNIFKASIYYVKKGDTYRLKYFSKKTGLIYGINRDISLIKKKERFLFDKTLNEFKMRLKMKQTSEEYIEVLVLDNKEISKLKYDSVKPKNSVEVIYVKQFDDSLWNGYSIIAPTKQMKDYRKIED